MIGCTKKNRENYPGKCFWAKKKETQVKIQARVSANWPSNNWTEEVTLGYIFKKIQFVANYRHTKVFGSIFQEKIIAKNHYA